MKPCITCGVVKPIDDFHLHPQMKDGHLNKCKECQNAYSRANQHKHKEARKEWFKKNPELRKLYNARSAKKCREKRLIVVRAWRAANRERLNAQARARFHADARYQVANILKQARRRAAKVEWADQAKIQSIYEEAKRLSTETGIPHDVDHIVPLKHGLVCGLHNEFNLRPIPASENRSKHNRYEVA